jgi:hypothetical protein
VNKTYIANLRAEAEAANLRSDEAKVKNQKTDKRILCDIPLADQIEALMATLPPAQRDRAWSMEELVARLQGKYSASPHPMRIGQALRQLGWETRRDWSRDGGGRRVWVRQETSFS